MHIVLIAGSNRNEASSTKLLQYMASELARKGALSTLFDLRHTPLPMYSKDDNTADFHVTRLLQLVGEADGVVLGTPEYHGSLSGALKNALDYIEKKHLSGKPVLSVSSSGGAVGVSSLTHLQGIVRNLHGINCPEWVSIGGDQRRFLPDGVPETDKVKQRVDQALTMLLHLAEKLKP